ncbi:MAG: glycoside hydrolase, partial [Bacteroidales bacterium]|nr:glycoside hydrolase [Bacteroidales bacterium]
MKKITFFLLYICCFTLVQAQSRKYVNHERRVPALTVDGLLIPVRPVNHLTGSKSTFPDLVGYTRYDMQTNASGQNRLYLYPDGTLTGIWMRGQNSAQSFPDLGTGYNTSDGTTWGAPPNERIENERCGSPSYAPLGATGEIVVSHTDASGLNIATRPIKGEGIWSQTLLPGPADAPAISWSRTITSGPENTSIHILAVTSTPYAGLERALLYYRSTDAGQTWDKTHIILPGLDSVNYSGFSPDEYAWGTARGDSIYFAIGGPYIDTFIMRSTDNGETWTKIPILNNGYKKFQTPPVYIAPWRSSDGSLAVEMDHNGIIHFSSGIGGGFISEGVKYIRTGLNGLFYWNTTMPMLDDSLNLDTLDNHYQLIYYYSDGPNPEDTLKNVPDYRVGLTSMPQITVDNHNNVYIIWSGITWENPDPTNSNYRHLFGRGWWNNYARWCQVVDFSGGFLYMFQEYVYPSMAKLTKNYKLQV